MVTKSEYQQSLDKVKQYERQMQKELVSDYTCCVCKTNKITSPEGINTDVLDQESAVWDGGTVTRITFGYGSVHDSDAYYVAICDTCIPKLKKDQLIVSIEELENKVRCLKS